MRAAMAWSDAHVACIEHSSSSDSSFSVVSRNRSGCCSSGRVSYESEHHDDARRENRRSMTREEVLRRVRERGDQLIIACGHVFDVARLGAIHPGGKQVLAENVGNDVTKLFFGENVSGSSSIGRRRRRRSHVHSLAAFKSLMHYRIGRLRDDDEAAHTTGGSRRRRGEPSSPVVAATKTSYDAWTNIAAGGYDACNGDVSLASRVRVDSYVDMDKPIVKQIGGLKAETYEEWLRFPSMGTESVRFFESDILEACSKAHWIMVPLIWIPVAVKAIVATICEASPWTFQTYQIDERIGVAIFCGMGYLLWFVLEYSIHRFIFHLSPVTTWGKTLHFIAHGCHHKFPMDRMRLVRHTNV